MAKRELGRSNRANGACQGSEWILVVQSWLLAGTTVKAVQSQVTLQGAAGRETWLGVDLLRGGGEAKLTGWIHSGELQRRAVLSGSDGTLILVSSSLPLCLSCLLATLVALASRRILSKGFLVYLIDLVLVY